MSEVDLATSASEISSKLSLTGALIFFLWYFMRKEGKKDIEQAKLLGRLTFAIVKLVDLLEDLGPKDNQREKKFNKIKETILFNDADADPPSSR